MSRLIPSWPLLFVMDVLFLLLVVVSNILVITAGPVGALPFSSNPIRTFSEDSDRLGNEILQIDTKTAAQRRVVKCCAVSLIKFQRVSQGAFE